MRYGFLNAFESRLATSLDAGVTTATLEAGDAAAMADASSNKQYPLVLAERDIRGVDVRREIVYVTGRSGDDLTITRAREETGDDDWPAGTVVEYRMTAGVLDTLVQPDDPLIEGVTAREAVAIDLGSLDLTDDTATLSVSMPSAVTLFVDRIELIVDGSDSPAGDPEVVVGEDATDDDTLLAATAVTVTAVGERQIEDAASPHGVTSLRAAVATAATGTTQSVRVIVRGSVWEL